MPQSNRRVVTVDLRGDMNNYYRYSVATYLKPLQGGGNERLAAYIHGYDGGNDELQVLISTMGPNDATWGTQKYVPNDAMCYELPSLGTVRHNEEFIHLIRNPQRRMRKGYNEECVQWIHLEGSGNYDHNILAEEVIRQVWYGCTERLSTNVVLENKRIYFKAEHVANVSDDGSIVFIPNKEKLGEFVCKSLASNWEEVRSKHSNLMLPS